MEPEVRDFLVRILQTISMSMVWLLVNMSFGIYFGFAFFEQAPTLWNIIFYLWFLASFAALIYYFKKKWKGWKEIGE
jgi:ABC-type anion transport system duplicated permease subunit